MQLAASGLHVGSEGKTGGAGGEIRSFNLGSRGCCFIRCPREGAGCQLGS